LIFKFDGCGELPGLQIRTSPGGGGKPIDGVQRERIAVQSRRVVERNGTSPAGLILILGLLAN